MLASAVLGLVIYSFTAMSYAHSTFITRNEAEARRAGRDKIEATLIEQLRTVSGKLDDLDKFLRERPR